MNLALPAIADAIDHAIRIHAALKHGIRAGTGGIAIEVCGQLVAGGERGGDEQESNPTI